MASSRPQLIFGDFTLAEQKYLEQPSCVQLPPWLPDDDAADNAAITTKNNLTENQSLQPLSTGTNVEGDEHQKTLVTEQNSCFLALKSDPSSEKDSGVVNGSAPKLGPDVGYSAIEENNKVSSNGDETETNDSNSENALVNGHAMDDDATVANGIADGELRNGKASEKISPVFSNEKSTENDSEDLSQSSPLVSSLPSSIAQKQTSWASLFSGSSQLPKTVSSSSTPKPIQTVTPQKSPIQPIKKRPEETVCNGLPSKHLTELVGIENDPLSKQLAEHIARNEAVYKSPGLMPRGLVNSSNWCYINATLQALLTSSPFCHLMRSLPLRQACPDTNVTSTSTPTLDSFVQLVKELKPLPKKNIKRSNNEQFQGPSYEPHCIYDMLATVKSKFAQRGRQEDAEEFLSCVLNRLHEEMLKVTEFHLGKNQPTQNSDSVVKNAQTDLGYEVPVHDDKTDDDANEDGDQWEEVTSAKKNRSHVMRRVNISKTPVSDIFRGELRSDFSQEGQRGTATLEPFFALPLGIDDQKTWSVTEALEHLTRLETVHDFTNSKTKTKVEATRRQTLETLPPILILHLKRFVYDKKGGLLKIGKEVQYHTDLVIGKELLSKSGKKITQDKRTYKLFAVVYHHGQEATGGHYTADVYHDGLYSWLRIDDRFIKATNVHEVVRHNPQRTAYLLYYKRTDLMAV